MLDKRYLSQFAQFFSSRVLRDLANKGKSKLIEQTLQYSGYELPNRSISVAQLYDLTYDLLVEGYRCEYVYINTLANKILLERHTYPESVLYTHLNTQRRVTDAVIFNGTSTAYEIKSELDSLARLNDQIEEYCKLFAEVFVVAHESYCDRLKREIPAKVGIILLNNNCEMETVRNAKDNSDSIDPSAIFDLLRTKEYCGIIQEEFGAVPNVPNTRLYSECKQLFSTLPPKIAHTHLVNAYRTRTNITFTKNLLETFPYSLKAAIFNSSLTKKQWRDLANVLQSQFVTA